MPERKCCGNSDTSVEYQEQGSDEASSFSCWTSHPSRIWSSKRIRERNLFSPMCFIRRRLRSRIGVSILCNSFNPAGVIWPSITRLSFSSRLRMHKPRCSNRLSSLVISGSRVIMRCAISLQGSPVGTAPRKMRSALYCVPVKSWFLKNSS
jgi:hypothetical protein